MSVKEERKVSKVVGQCFSDFLLGISGQQTKLRRAFGVRGCPLACSPLRGGDWFPPKRSFPEDTLPRELTLQPPQAVIPGEAAAGAEAVPTFQQRAAKGHQSLWTYFLGGGRGGGGGARTPPRVRTPERPGKNQQLLHTGPRERSGVQAWRARPRFGTCDIWSQIVLSAVLCIV